MHVSLRSYPHPNLFGHGLQVGISHFRVKPKVGLSKIYQVLPQSLTLMVRAARIAHAGKNMAEGINLMCTTRQAINHPSSAI